MKEQDLIDLGFERTDVSVEESGEDPFHYYTYDFTNGFSLITSANDEAVDNKWFVEIFNTEDEIRFTDKQDVSNLIELINANKI
jgi:hypothetical protein